MINGAHGAHMLNVLGTCDMMFIWSWAYVGLVKNSFFVNEAYLEGMKPIGLYK